jgi:hypothetical protein
LGEEFGLKVRIKIALWEFIEDFFVTEGVISRGDAAAGDGGDDVDFVEEGAGLAGWGGVNGRFLEGLEDAVGECRGTGTASGEGEDDEGVITIFIGCGKVAEAIAGVVIEVGEGGVDWIMSTTGVAGSGKKNEKNEETFHKLIIPWCWDCVFSHRR